MIVISCGILSLNGGQGMGRMAGEGRRYGGLVQGKVLNEIKVRVKVKVG